MYLSPMIVHELGYLIPVCDVGDLPGVDKVLPARVRVDGVELGEERLERRLGRLVVLALVLVRRHLGLRDVNAAL